MHPLDPYLASPVGLLEEVHIEIRFPPDCPRRREGCTGTVIVSPRLIVVRRLVRRDVKLEAFLRRIRCKVCRGRPAELALMERPDRLGWMLKVPPHQWW